MKEEAVQPCTTKNDYPSADDRTVDYRTTINNSNCEAGPGEGEKLATLTEDPPPFVSRRVERGDPVVEGVDEYRWTSACMVKKNHAPKTSSVSPNPGTEGWPGVEEKGKAGISQEKGKAGISQGYPKWGPRNSTSMREVVVFLQHTKGKAVYFLTPLKTEPTEIDFQPFVKNLAEQGVYSREGGNNPRQSREAWYYSLLKKNPCTSCCVPDRHPPSSWDLELDCQHC